MLSHRLEREARGSPRRGQRLTHRILDGGALNRNECAEHIASADGGHSVIERDNTFRNQHEVNWPWAGQCRRLAALDRCAAQQSAEERMLVRHSRDNGGRTPRERARMGAQKPHAVSGDEGTVGAEEHQTRNLDDREAIGQMRWQVATMGHLGPRYMCAMAVKFRGISVLGHTHQFKRRAVGAYLIVCADEYGLCCKAGGAVSCREIEADHIHVSHCFRHRDCRHSWRDGGQCGARAMCERRGSDSNAP